MKKAIVLTATTVAAVVLGGAVGAGVVSAHTHTTTTVKTPSPVITNIVEGPGPVQHKPRQVAKKVTVTTPATPAATTPAAAPQPALTNPSAVVQQFYTDITNGDYYDAWLLGGDNIGGSSYSGWVAGYDTTASIYVTSYGALSNGGSVWAEITATQDNGSVNYYYGTYTVSGGVITSADIKQID